jgi:hypothetical protein
MMGSGTPDGARWHDRRLAVTAVCAVLVVATAGCARGRQQGGADIGLSSVERAPAGVGVPCSDPGPTAEPQAPSAPPSPEPLAADFVPIAASRCTGVVRPVPGDGEWQMRDEQEATGPWAGRVRGQRPPAERSAGQGPCLAIAMAPIVITLTDARGRTTVPAIPHNACGLPAQAALHAIGALAWKTVKETKVRQVRSQLEVDSGCPGGYKPVIAIQAAATSQRAADTGPLFPGTPPPTLEVCQYTLDPTSTIGVTGSGTFAIGKLTTATKLTGASVVRLVAGLNAAPPATAHCDQPQAPFALLAGTSVVIEIGGCNRATGAVSGLRQVDAATAAILAG